MALTQGQLDAIDHLMNIGYGTPEEPAGLRRLASNFGQHREGVDSLLRFHTLIPDATATTVLNTLQTRMLTSAQGIVDLLT